MIIDLVLDILLTEVRVCKCMCVYVCVYTHYLAKGMWTPARQTSHSKIMGINMEWVPPFCYHSLHSSGMAFY